jgi:glycosyltransferase involved in cell wall biosynthesis
MTKKRKILFCSEAHWMPTGFGTYTWEILSRLHATGKFEIAEFSQFATVNHPEDRARWRLYANAIKPDDPRMKHYNAHPYNVYGAWRFERVLVDFRCDCCVSFLDPWMMSYQYASPLRPYFHHILMPTVDSAPQDEDWINMFSTADDVFTYSDWAVKVLKEQGGDAINVHCKTPPGTDHNLFKPLDKKSIRKEMGINPEWNIVGTVMRNQRRKLYPDLLLAFKKFLQICEDNGQQELANTTYMLWHTGYPDAGWNIPLILRESGIAHKVLFSYVCGSCGHWHISTFKEMAAICPNCNKTTMHLASVGKGLDRNLLPKLYNLMDLYIQYAVAEGFCLPLPEAASCSVPLMVVNYSAMEDFVDTLGAIPITPFMFRELETHALRALPHNDECAEKIYKFFTSSDEYRKDKGNIARQGVIDNYSYDKTAKIWENFLESVPLKGQSWDSPPKFIPKQNKIPELSNDQLAKWIILEMLKEPEKLNTYYHSNLLYQLNFGVVRQGRQIQSMSRDVLIESLQSRVGAKNYWEQVRTGQIILPTEDFIDYAHLKDEI